MQETSLQTNLKIFDKHPAILQNMAIMRDRRTNCENFRTATKKITSFLMYEAVKNLPLSTKTISTPLETIDANVIDESIDIFVAPILRAGLIFNDAALDILPQAKIFHLGMCRNEETLNPEWYYNKLPLKFNNPEKTYVYITDPMLATGGSLLDAIKLFADKDVAQENITAVCIISAPEGISKIRVHYPDVKIISASLDRTLNEKGYILPGLGDAGDRIFNTL